MYDALGIYQFLNDIQGDVLWCTRMHEFLGNNMLFLMFYA